MSRFAAEKCTPGYHVCPVGRGCGSRGGGNWTAVLAKYVAARVKGEQERQAERARRSAESESESNTNEAGA